MRRWDFQEVIQDEEEEISDYSRIGQDQQLSTLTVEFAIRS